MCDNDIIILSCCDCNDKDGITWDILKRILTFTESLIYKDKWTCKYEFDFIALNVWHLTVNGLVTRNFKTIFNKFSC